MTLRYASNDAGVLLNAQRVMVVPPPVRLPPPYLTPFLGRDVLADELVRPRVTLVSAPAGNTGGGVMPTDNVRLLQPIPPFLRKPPRVAPTAPTAPTVPDSPVDTPPPRPRKKNVLRCGVEAAGVAALVALLVWVAGKSKSPRVAGPPTIIKTTVIQLSDAGALHDVFYSGGPHLVMCLDDSEYGKGAQQEVAKLAGLLQEAGMTAVTVDCSSPVPASGVSLATRFKINMGNRPTWVVVANGKAPVQLSPHLVSYRDRLVEVAASYTRLRLDSLLLEDDWHACVRQRVGGCLVLVTRRFESAVEPVLAPFMAAHRTIQFSVMDPDEATLVPRAASHAAALAATPLQRATAAGASGETAEVLIAIRRVHHHHNPDAAVETGGTRLLLTLLTPASGGKATAADVAALLAALAEGLAAAAKDTGAPLPRHSRVIKAGDLAWRQAADRTRSKAEL